MLEIKNINKNYLKYKNNIEILKDISYVFHSKKVYTIIGKSGVGKTTLIKILGLILNYDSGEILLNNKSVEKLTEDEKAEIRNKHIGFIFQNFYLNPLMKAYENIMVPMYLDNTLTNKERKEKACQLLKKVDLINREEHYPKELSGGEQQRVAIARALANNPDIILADEPTGALDLENVKNVLDILKKVAKEGKCVIIVSHDERVSKYADVVLELNDKGLVEVKNENKL